MRIDVIDPIKPDELRDVDPTDIVNLLDSQVKDMQNLQEGKVQVCVFTISGLLYHYMHCTWSGCENNLGTRVREECEEISDIIKYVNAYAYLPG